MIRRKRSAGLWTLSLSLVLLGGGCSRHPETNANVPLSAEKTEPGLVVLDPMVLQEGRIVLEEVKQERLPEVLRVTGRIGVNENRTARVGAITGGRVVRVLANVGDPVRQGQLLAEMHSHEVHDVRAELTKAQAELDRRRSELQFARKARDRTARLYQLKAASLEQLQRAEADLTVAEQAVISAQAEIERITEHLRYLGIAAEDHLEAEQRARPAAPGTHEPSERVPVVAPLAGVVLKRMVTPGAVVTASSDLFEISDLRTLWVNVEVHEKYLQSLKTGLPVQISVQAYPESSFEGRITYVGETLDATTRTIQLRCETENARRALKPEMYATITISLGSAAETPLIHSSGISEVHGESIVFVHEKDSRFRVRRIKPGRQTGLLTEILDGLRPGERSFATAVFC